ncbi:MAG: VanW family protein [Gammaproteobacteria bacterium]|nr:VanW family protein [Gammaproteobacteria bacterium]
MITLNLHRRLGSIMLLFGILLFSDLALAKVPADFGAEYGLLVHSQNEDQPIPRLKAIQILRRYFPDSELTIKLPIDGEISQREYILWHEKLEREVRGEITRLPDEALYFQTWLRVRRNNLLPESKLTFGSLQEYLYRLQVSEYYDYPYAEGLVLDQGDISNQNYPTLYDVRELKSEILEKTMDLRRSGALDSAETRVLGALGESLETVKVLEEETRKAQHPFYQIADLPEDLKALIADNELEEVLSKITYNYQNNDNNRKHNLVTGSMKMNGRFYAPGEEINFIDEIGRDGWWMYKYGWVISGGEAAWEFGGGLCGSATLTFTPAWKAGLDILQRYPHSIYYSDLYPQESFGLDSAIYRGAKNLIMKNNTKSPILFYVSNDAEKEEITLYIIGNSPYYRIDFEGPTKLASNTFKWIRRMESFDGTVVSDELITRYGLLY